MNHPVLLVGIGGSGLNTLSALNRCLAANPAMRPRMSSDIYYLAIDTEEAALDQFKESIGRDMLGWQPPFAECVSLSKDVHTLNEIIHPMFEEPFFGQADAPGLARLREHWWFDQNGSPFSAPNISNLNFGAGMCPQVAYGLAWHRLHEIGESVKRILDRILSRNIERSFPLENMEIFVIAGLAGGTGHGAWAPIALKIHEILHNNYGLTVPAFGIFFDASVFDSIAHRDQKQGLALKVNSVIGISELSYWMQESAVASGCRSVWRLPSMDSPGHERSDVLRFATKLGVPLSQAYLICGHSRSAILNDTRQYHEMAGEAIYAMITTHATCNTHINCDNHYSSFSAVTFEVDVLHIQSYLELLACRTALDELVSNKGDVSANVAAFFAEFPFNTIVSTVDDLRPDEKGSLYQRTVSELFAIHDYNRSFSIIANEMTHWSLSKAQRFIMPLLLPASEEEIWQVVRKVLGNFLGDRIEGAVLAAIKKTHIESAERQSVGRLLVFLNEIKRQIVKAQKDAPGFLLVPTLIEMDPTASVMQSLANLSRRNFIDRLQGRTYSEHDVDDIVHSEGNGYWGIVPEGVAAVNYPKIKAALAEALQPAIAIIEKLIRSCEKLADCCHMACAAFAQEEPVAAGGEVGDNAFGLLFSTPCSIDETLYRADDAKRTYHRILRPIFDSPLDLQDAIRNSTLIKKGMYEFILRIFDYDTMEEFSSGDNIKTLNGFTDELIAATRRNVCLSEWFMLKHFTFEKVLERNRNFWNRAIVDAQGSDARRAELGEMFVATLGVKPRHDPRNPMEPPVLPEIHELMPSIAASLASNCSPWWVLDKSGEERYEVTMLVPFDLMDLERVDFESILYNMCRTPISVIDKSDLQMSEYISPFGYVAYSSDAIRRTKVEMDRGKHPLDQVRSLGYWNDSFVLDMLRRAELPTGESIFAPKGMNHAYGYISPCFVRDPYVAALRWKPWNEELEHAPSAENKVTPPRETQESFPDVFISYRRDNGLEKARTLQQALKARGYSVFFDFDSLQDGEFNEAIFKAIENSKVVVAFLSDGSLDRCSAEGDWVRMELEYAFKSGKKIIPVAESATYNHWIWPASLPESLSKLRDIQLSEFHTGSLFEESVDKIVNARFGFRPRKP